MIFTICGSMSFATEMLQVRDVLSKAGHEVFLPLTTNECVEDPDTKYNEDVKFCIENDVITDHFGKIEKSDAIVVLNHSKGGVPGYVGGSSLMEMGLAYYLRKPIFVLNDLPHQNQLRYVTEIKIMKPIFLFGDINNIFNHI